jgi:hypothetical protein
LEDDEIIRYSVERLVRRKIENELCSRIRDIVDINFQIRNNDLILKVKLKDENGG